MGDVKIKSLSITEEGVLDGRCYMGNYNNKVEIEYQNRTQNDYALPQEEHANEDLHMSIPS